MELLKIQEKIDVLSLHNIDSCRACACIIKLTGCFRRFVYNVKLRMEEISIVDLVGLIGTKMGIEKPAILFSGYRASDPERRILNTDKIRQRTCGEPVVNLSQRFRHVFKN